MPSEIQKATAASDAAILQIASIDAQIEEVEARIASLEEQSAAAIKTSDTVDGMATEKLRTAGQLAAHRDILADLEEQRTQASEDLLTAMQNRASAKKTAELAAFRMAAAEFADLLEQAEPVLGKLIEAAEAVNHGAAYKSADLVPLVKHLTSQLLMENGGKLRVGFPASVFGYHTVGDLRGFQEYVSWHCDKPTAAEYAFKHVKHVATQEHKRHWTQLKTSDPEKYLSNRKKADARLAAKAKNAA